MEGGLKGADGKASPSAGVEAPGQSEGVVSDAPAGDGSGGDSASSTDSKSAGGKAVSSDERTALGKISKASPAAAGIGDLLVYVLAFLGAALARPAQRVLLRNAS